MNIALSDSLDLPCGTRVRNRIAKAAMTEGLADSHNRPTGRHLRIYRRWARGGAGLLLTGNVQVDRRYLERAGNVAIDPCAGRDRLRRLEAFAEAGTANGTQLWVQLSHAGRQTPAIIAPEPVGPSAVPVALPGGRFGMPRALTAEEIRDIVNRFAVAAGTARAAGFGGVQVHAAHGYLISEFLSPRANRRDDEWGGSLANRARLLLEVLRAVRRRVGPDFPVAVKLNSADFQKGGFSFDECLEVVERLNEEGLDLLEISGGNYEQPRLLGIDGLEPAFEEKVRASTRAREAYFFDYALRLKSVARMPLMVTGGFRSAAAMSEAVGDGGIDLVGIARPLCVDPGFVNKILSGRIEAAPEVEKGLRLGPGIFGPHSPFDFVKALNGFARIGWYYEQIYRLADGKDPDLRMSALKALLAYDRTEKAKARALARAAG